MKQRWLMMLVLVATSSLAEDREACLAQCKQVAKQLETDCLKHPKVPNKQECSEARKAMESMCSAECASNSPRGRP